MKKVYLALLLTIGLGYVTLVIGLGFGGQKQSLVSIEKRETVLVGIECDAPAKGICGGGSGSYLGNGLVLTARHVVLANPLDPQSTRRNLVVQTYAGKTVQATLMFVSENTDYAILRVHGIGGPAVHLACRRPLQDEPITIVGNPGLVVDWAVTHGTVASDRRWDDTFFGFSTGGNVDLTLLGWDDIVAGTALVLPGSSGGPVFDADGAQIGVVVAGNPMLDGFIPTQAICAELPRL